MRFKIYVTLILSLFQCLFVCGADMADNVDSLIREGIKCSVEKNYQHSLELLYKAQKLVSKETSPERLFSILVNIGVDKAELLDYNDALIHFSSAYKLAVERLDKRREMSALNNIAGLYMQDNKNDKASEYYMKAYDNVKNTADSLFIGGCAMNIAYVSLRLNEFDKAHRFINIAKRHLEKYHIESIKLQTIEIEYYLGIGQNRMAYDSAAKLYNKVKKDGQLVGSSTWIDVQMAVVKSAMEVKDHVAVIKYSLEALDGSLNIVDKKYFYEVLAEAFFLTKRYAEAFAYKDSFVIANDSLWSMSGKRQFENSRIKFELFKRDKELEEYKTQSKMQLYFWIFIILLAVALIWGLSNKVEKNKKQKRIIELQLDQEKKRQEILQNRYNEEQTRVMIERQQLQHRIEMNGRELISRALVHANINQQIMELLNKVKTSDDIRSSKDLKLKSTIKALAKQLDDGSEWKNFTTYFEQVNDTFLNKLMEANPSLTANEIRFLSLVYINLTTKEIAVLLNITPEYCKKKKQQIAHKLGLETTKMLYSYLISI